MKLKPNISGRLLLMTLVTGLFAQTACEQDYELDLPLAVTQNTLNLDAGGGQTHVLVYSSGDWNVAFDGDIPWATIDRTSGSGNGEFVFTFELNPGIVRKADVILTSGSNRQVISMIQNGFVGEASLTIMKESAKLPDWESLARVPFDTNMDLALERITSRVTYGDGAEETASEGWISDIVVTEDAILFETAANDTGESRLARLIVEVNDNVNEKIYSSSIEIVQEAESGYMRFEQDELEVESFAKQIVDPWTTNMELFFDDVECEIIYGTGDSGWITNVVPGNESVTFDVAENMSAGTREATLKFTYSDENGNRCSAEQRIVQARPAAEVPFEELREMQPAAGKILLERDFIIGTVISEPGNSNLETNPHLSWTEVDYSVNEKTAYVQSADGRYGFRIQTETESDVEALQRYATVKISLAGLTLTREEEPVRYTLSGLTAANVLESTPGSSSTITRKEKYIEDLTDDDLYTFVSLKDVEFAFDGGTYGNFHEGYALKSDLIPGGNATATRCDCVPRTLRDVHGSTLNMLVNSQTSWRRPGHRVPQGSGTASGILVHSSLLRYAPDGNIGRYQLRPLCEEDLAISNSEGFSTKLVEWEWSAPVKTEEGSKSRIVPTLGSGVMDTSAQLVSGNETGRTANWIGLSFSSYASSTAGRYNGKWWNFDKNEGESVSWSFSTSGVTGPDRHLTLVFTAVIGNQTATTMHGPNYWNLEYSTDGVIFTPLKENFLIYPAPLFAYSGMNMPAGIPEYVFELPDALCGQPNVTIRIKAASKVCSSSAALASSEVKKTDGAVYFRFDAVTIKYNK